MAADAFLDQMYFDPYFEMQACKILPGEFYVTQQDLMLVSVVGSCVVACIRDTQLGWGGMTHFMLPPEANLVELVDASTRYGSHALELLINELLKRGAQRDNLEAKVFGGGKVLAVPASQVVSQRNAEFVEQYLQAESIPLVAQSLLGDYPLKVYFFPTSGRVLVKKLKKLNNTTIFEREARYFEELVGMSVAGKIELFTPDA